MIIWDCPELINDWVNTKGGGHAPRNSCTALGYADDQGKLAAGVVFHSTNGVHCYVNIAITSGVFPVSLLKASLRYAFGQLKLRRLTFIIAEGNIPSINLVRELGANPEATLQDADINGNLLIFALFPRNCKIWSRINGQEFGRTSSTESGEDHPPANAGE